MLMIDCPLDVIDRGVGHTRAFENVQPLLGCLGLQDILYYPVKCITVLDSERVGNEPGIGFPFGLPNLVAKDAVEFVVATSDCDVGIVRLICPVWDYRSYKSIS